VPTSPAIDVSIITPTWRRTKDLWKLIESVNLQELGDLQAEHLIVPDGPDASAQLVAQEVPDHPRIHRCFLSQSQHFGQYGAGCKDVGLREARGRFVLFWDDDNWFYPHALRHMHSLVADEKHAIGVAQLRHNAYQFQPVPNLNRWREDGERFTLGNIDTGCFILATETARSQQWYDQQGPGTDFRYFDRIVSNADTSHSINISEQIIGVHL